MFFKVLCGNTQHTLALLTALCSVLSPLRPSCSKISQAQPQLPRSVVCSMLRGVTWFVNCV